MKYTVPDPYCDGNVNIMHVTDGIWAISSDNQSCESCARFMFRISSVFDNSPDDEIIRFLVSMEAKSVD